MKIHLFATILTVSTCGFSAVYAANWSTEMIAQRNACQQQPVVTESPWLTTGPLKAKGFSDPLFPEQGVKPDIKDANGHNLWLAPKNPLPNGIPIDLVAPDSSSTYFYRVLTANRACKQKLSFGSDDGLEVWLNGKKIISDDSPRGVAPDQNVVTVDLVEGKNELLAKVFNRTGGCGFYYAHEGELNAIITSLTHQYPEQMRLFKAYIGDGWFQQKDTTSSEQNAINHLLGSLKENSAYKAKLTELINAKAPATNPAWLDLFEQAAHEVDGFAQSLNQVEQFNATALRMAIEDLVKTYPDKYKNGAAYLATIQSFEKDLPQIKADLKAGDPAAAKRFQEASAISRKALLENPALDFDKILLVRRSANNLCLPQNWQGNTSMNPSTENELVTFEYKNPDAKLERVYKPAKNYFVGDLHLHFGAKKLLFSSIGTHNHWQIFEINTDGTGLRQVSKGDEDDVDNYDATYLPNGRIIYDCSATFQGVPCVGGSDYVANLFIMNADGTGVRRLCFDQDNDWCPIMMPCGRVMYTRWEYTDTAHYFSRVLMSMNPDGTGQNEVYHANSYWPNSTFYAHPLPGSDTRFVAVVSGHHGVPRMGELVLFDVTRGRQENEPAVQRIPGYGKPVKSIIKDQLVADSWPLFLHPFPISDKHFLVSCKPTPQSEWGLYLVDIFDNMTLLKEEPGWAMLEPIALRPTPTPPIIPDKIKLEDKTATVIVQDVYSGEGLRGVPRGSVKKLRLLQYEYSYRNQGGHYFVGMEGPWDVHRIVGTVPVKEDGSAMFHIPANTPIAVQPLDADGKALQQMRSWFVGMPGEVISCVGCHEKQNQSAAFGFTKAAKGTPSEIEPWYGPTRGFSFIREVQPVLDKYCVGCHNGSKPERPNFANSNLVATTTGSPLPGSYLALHPYVRRNGPEGDYHTLTPLEFHANTSLVIQMLRKGHHNVKMDAEAWDHLITWIDLNVPNYGTFSEIAKIPSNFEKRRYESKEKYANLEEDVEVYPSPMAPRPAFIPPAPAPAKPAKVTLPGWPLGAEKARQMQDALGNTDLKLDLGEGLAIALKKIPAGEFVMGDVNGDSYEYPMAAVKITKPFYMATTEISLEQYQRFNPAHHNGYYDQHNKDQVRPGYLMDADPKVPVIRVSWQQAMDFCKWLSAKSGRKVTLPTEAQWEWACRAGTDTPFFYGDLNTDFGQYANLADAMTTKLAVAGIDPQPLNHPDKFWDYLPKEPRFNDGVVHLAEVGHYKPNAWGLHEMIGNVGEWTLNDFRPYPYVAESAKNDATSLGNKVVRGGSWSERPLESRASSRLDYPSWQRVYDVGFRVIVEEGGSAVSSAK